MNDTNHIAGLPLGISPVGAFGVAGNVWERVYNWYQDDYYSSSPSINPTGPITGTVKVLRGGGWGSHWNSLRVSNRGFSNALELNNYFGFRCAASP